MLGLISENKAKAVVFFGGLALYGAALPPAEYKLETLLERQNTAASFLRISEVRFPAP